MSCDQRQEALERKRSALEAQIKVLKMDFAAEELELERIIGQQQTREEQLQLERDAMNRLRTGTPEHSPRETTHPALAKGAGDPA